ncbi:MAG: TerB family tellurite resistance protein [SAR324 cluster bacterium]|nr:TerB family tellurite resistance protein [SAR324 cluster bacterium]
MNKSTFTQLDPKQQFWYARTMVNMALADGHIHPSEQKYMQIIFELFINSPKRLADLKKQSQRSSPEKILPVKGLSHELSITILEDCVDAAIADAEFHEKEQEMIYEIGKHLKCSPGEIEETISRGKQQLAHIFSLAS